MNIINTTPLLVNGEGQGGLMLNDGQMTDIDNAGIFVQILNDQFQASIKEPDGIIDLAVIEDNYIINSEIIEDDEKLKEGNTDLNSSLTALIPMPVMKFESLEKNNIDASSHQLQINNIDTENSISIEQEIVLPKDDFLLADNQENLESGLKLKEGEVTKLNTDLDLLEKDYKKLKNLYELTPEKQLLGDSKGVPAQGQEIKTNILSQKYFEDAQKIKEPFKQTINKNLKNEIPINQIEISTNEINMLSRQLIDQKAPNENVQSEAEKLETLDNHQFQLEGNEINDDNPQQNFNERESGTEIFNDQFIRRESQNILLENMEEKFTLRLQFKELSGDKIDINIVKVTYPDNVTQKITVQLYPEELGTLEIKLDINSQHNQHQNIVHISVENPHTLELLRQDIASLEENLHKLGILPDSGTINLNLEQDSSNTYEHNNHQKRFEGKNKDETIIAYEDRLAKVPDRYRKISNKQLDITI